MFVLHLRKPAAVLSCLAMGLLWLYGCSGSSSSTTSAPSTNTRTLPPAVAAAVRSATPVDSTLVTANNQFGFDLFNQQVQQNPTGNIFISPTSVALALEIVQNGAENGTLTAMEQTLHLSGKSVTDVDTANAALQASLVNPDPQVTLTIANSLWIHKNTTQVSPAFVQANTTYYGSEVGDLAGAPDAINAWVNTNTSGQIPTIVGADNYNAYVAMVVNAVYFKGQWTTPFDPAATVAAPFTRLDGSTVTYQQMKQTGTCSYYRGTNFQVVQLPYGSKRMSMVVVLPDKGTNWNSFLATITPAALNTWLSQATSQLGNIALPRFQSNYSADLAPSLTALGMGVAFTDQADFSGIAPNTLINKVRHVTALTVNEQGTVASGGTAVGIVPTSIAVAQFTMTVDHPFFCAILDAKTGVLLFMGCILDPTASA